MTEYEVYKKVKEALEAIKEYEKIVKEGKGGMWQSDITEGLENLNEKRHVLGASGDTCTCCNGSGRA